MEKHISGKLKYGLCNKDEATYVEDLRVVLETDEGEVEVPAHFDHMGTVVIFSYAGEEYDFPSVGIQDVARGVEASIYIGKEK